MSEKRPNWLLRGAGIAAAAVEFISTTLGLWFTIESHMQDAMAENATQITLQIKESARDLAGIQRDDLAVRIRIVKQEIRSYEQASKPVPERILIELEAMQDQLGVIKEKWFAH